MYVVDMHAFEHTFTKFLTAKMLLSVVVKREKNLRGRETESKNENIGKKGGRESL